MKKIPKIISAVIILAIIITALLGIFAMKNVNAADYECELSSRTSARDIVYGISETKMLDYNNIYCVSHGQYINLPNGSGNFTVVSKAELRGNYVTLVKYNKNGTIEKIGHASGGGMYGILTYEMAAVFANAGGTDDSSEIGYGDGTIATMGNYNPSEVQLAIWHMWNEWIDIINATEYGFEKATGNTEEYGSTEAWAERVNYAKDNDINYPVDIYFLSYFPEDNGGSNASSFQNLILVETDLGDLKQDIPIQKIWNDNENAAGVRPTSIKFELRDGTKNDLNNSSVVSTVTLNANNNWKGVFQDIDYYAKSYWLREVTDTPNYESSTKWDSKARSYTVTNTLKPITISVQKSWNDYSNEDGTRPSYIIARLKKNGVNAATKTLNASTSWKAEFTELPKYDSSGNLINYTVEEVNVPTGYTANVTGSMASGFTITNTHIPKVTLKIVKSWDDDNDRDGLRATISSIRVNVKDSASNNTRTVSLTKENGYTLMISGINKYDSNGNPTTFTVTEGSINDYEYKGATVTGPDANNVVTITLNNYHEPEKVNLEVKKVWDDQDDLDEYRPSYIYAALYKNGVYSNSKILRESNSWSCKWENLHKNENGQEINYTIKETRYASQNSAETIPEYEAPVYKKEVKTENDITTISYTITNKHTPQYDGYIEIKGNVWCDGAAGKGNDIDGVYTKGGASIDKGLEGIKVRLKDVDGNQTIKATYSDKNGELTRTDYAETDSNGNYAIRVNYDNSQKVYKLYENSTTVKENLQTAYVEFEYDANKYTTVKDVSTLTYDNETEKLEALSAVDKSKATENSEQRTVERRGFDQKHYATGPNTAKSTEWKDTITARTIAMSNYNNNTCMTTTTRNETIKYCNGNGIYIRTNPSGAWNNVLNGQRYKDITSSHHNTASQHTSSGHSMRTWDIEVEIINNINLGLFEREQPEVSIIEDISNVEIQMNGQKYTYLYNVKSDKYADAEIKAKFQNKDTYTYRRPVNPADIAYIQEPANNNLMKAYITYEVKIGNLSTTLPVKVNEIINAYDSKYTLISVSKGHLYNEIDKNEFKTINIEELQMTVQPGQESEAIQLKYEISTKALIGLLNKDATLNNAVEIIGYTTYYGENTLYAEQQTGGRTNNKYGGRDDSSQPGNANFEYKTASEIKKAYEDAGKEYKENPVDRIYSYQEVSEKGLEYDTDIAPSFVLCKDDKVNKKLSGTVWQDTDVDTTDNNRLGNGKQDENAKNIKGVKVELYEVKDDGSLVLAKLYRINTDTATVETKDAIAYTNENGNYSFGGLYEDIEYGVVTDRYVIKYTYGKDSTIENVVVSGRDYKSTIISQDNQTLYKLLKGEEIDGESDEWHLDMNQDINYSIAVDNIETRLNNENNLIYENFEQNIEMLAESKVFETQVEFDIDTGEDRYKGQVDKDAIQELNENVYIVEGTSNEFKNELSVFDFGLIERPREDIFVETSIDYLKVTLANGQVLTEGNPKADSLSYVKAIGFNQDIESGDDARRALDKQSIIEIDSELIQGATLDVRYEIKVTNNGEIDYDYSKGTEYYYFGTNTENVPVITNSVNKLVYYMDNDLVWTVDNEKWTQKSADELFNDRLISENTKNAISDNYTTFITEQFVNIAPKGAGENVKVDYISAQRMIGNSNENKFDNQAEILEIDGKIARTIKGINENGIPQVKTYKMGNYVPGLDPRDTYEINDETGKNKSVYVPTGLEKAGWHEQDDDRVSVVITPPTGLATYIMIYGIIGLIVLIILAGGVVFIKKKVLRK